MKKRFTEEQIIGFLREVDAGMAIKDLCRRHGFSEASYYLWRSKFGGMSVSDAKRFKSELLPPSPQPVARLGFASPSNPRPSRKALRRSRAHEPMAQKRAHSPRQRERESTTQSPGFSPLGTMRPAT